MRSPLGSTAGPCTESVRGKDLYNTADIRTTSSSQVRAGYVPDIDSAAVALLSEAGRVLIGKTETHEFTYGALTLQTGNPGDHTRIPGGSSGVSAAAVGASAVHVALGAGHRYRRFDLHRVRALRNGRPQADLRRVPRTGVASLFWALGHAGPLTRNAIGSAPRARRADPLRPARPGLGRRHRERT